MYLIYQHLVGETVIHLESCYMIILFFSKYRQNFKNAVIFASNFFFFKEKESPQVQGFFITSAHAQSGPVKPKSRRRLGEDNRWKFALRGFGL